MRSRVALSQALLFLALTLPAAAEDDTDLANPTIDTIEVCDLGAHAPTFTPSAQ